MKCSECGEDANYSHVCPSVSRERLPDMLDREDLAQVRLLVHALDCEDGCEVVVGRSHESGKFRTVVRRSREWVLCGTGLRLRASAENGGR